MKKRLLKIITLVLLTWPTALLHAQETSYTIQDFEGEYGLTMITMEMVDADKRIPIDSEDPQAIIDQILRTINDLRLDSVHRSSFVDGYQRLKEDFESSFEVDGGKFIEETTNHGLQKEKIIDANQPTPLPIFETKANSPLYDVGYLVFDKHDLYHIDIADYKEEGQTLYIDVLGKKDHAIINNQIDQPLFAALLPEGIVFDEYGYQDASYDDLLAMPDWTSLEVTFTGKIVKILELESYAYEFIVEDNKDSNQYYVKWNSEPNLDIAEGDTVYIRGQYMEMRMDYETNQEYPYIIVTKETDTVEKVD
ncbi:hypothetical protein ACWOB1_06070 [Facklamia languida]|uniref:Uncharacterized protein n=1 Tax=Facklamia languida CCUG 37842 TaxID=883113 RepID=H3NKT0_9LACT|nr:hypothetical protein [Facklamia languida]EHR36208.1 hypothetical protein HMPREF9708_01469 [Facklamia languida CCUG 37842]